MMVSVVMSRATRVPGFSLALSTFVRQPTTYRGPLLAFTMTANTQESLGRSHGPSANGKPLVSHPLNRGLRRLPIGCTALSHIMLERHLTDALHDTAHHHTICKRQDSSMGSCMR